MKKLFVLILFVLVSIPFNLLSQSKGIPYTLEDRDRLIRVEAEQKALRNEMNARFEKLNLRFDDQKSFLTIITSMFTVLTLSVIGFAWWDRRTTIGKAKEETISVIESEGSLKSLIKSLRELAKEDDRLAHVLRNYHLL